MYYYKFRLDYCTCPNGWTGEDCSIPMCSSCPPRHICTAPDTCTCIPGFEGSSCEIPQCIQECVHGEKAFGDDPIVMKIMNRIKMRDDEEKSLAV